MENQLHREAMQLDQKAFRIAMELTANFNLRIDRKVAIKAAWLIMTSWMRDMYQQRRSFIIPEVGLVRFKKASVLSISLPKFCGPTTKVPELVIEASVIDSVYLKRELQKETGEAMSISDSSIIVASLFRALLKCCVQQQTNIEFGFGTLCPKSNLSGCDTLMYSIHFHRVSSNRPKLHEVRQVELHPTKPRSKSIKKPGFNRKNYASHSGSTLYESKEFDAKELAKHKSVSELRVVWNGLVVLDDVWGSLLSNNVSSKIEERIETIKALDIKKPIINQAARTSLALVRESNVMRLLSDVIGSHYSPTAERLKVDPRGKCIRVESNWEVSEENVKLLNSSTRKNTGSIHHSVQLTRQPRNDRSRSWREEFNPVLMSKEQQQQATNRQRTNGTTNEIRQPETLSELYNWYIHNAINRDALAPMKPEWFRNIVTLLPQDKNSAVNEQTQVSQSTNNLDAVQHITEISSLLRTLMKQVQESYYFSGSKAIVDYALKSEYQRRRLGLLDWPIEPAKAAHQGITTTCSNGNKVMNRLKMQSIQRGVLNSTNYLVVHPLVVQITNVTSRFTDLVLVDLPRTRDEYTSMSWAPQTLGEFESYVMTGIENCRKQLLNEWYPRILELIRNSITNEELDPEDSVLLEHFFGVVGVVMQRLLRGVVDASLLRMEHYFKLYDRDQDQEEQMEHCKPALVVKVISKPIGTDSQNVAFKLEYSTEEFTQVLHRIFNTMLSSLNDVVRVEHQSLGAGIAGTGRFILQVNPGIPAYFKRRKGLVDIACGNYIDTTSLCERYNKFAFLLENVHQSAQVSTDASTTHGLKFAGQSAQNKQQQVVGLEVDAVQHINLARVEAQVCRCRAAKKAIESYLSNTVNVNMFVLNGSDLNQILLQRADECESKMLRLVASNIIDVNMAACKRFGSIAARIHRTSSTCEELTGSEMYLEKVKSVAIVGLVKDYERSKVKLDFLFKYQIGVQYEVLHTIGATSKWVSDAGELLYKAEEQLAGERATIENTLAMECQQCLDDLDKLEIQVDSVKDRGDTRHYREHVRFVRSLHETLGKNVEIAAALNKRECTLGVNRSDFSKLFKLQQMLEPFFSLWTTIETFQTNFYDWNSLPVIELQADQVEKDVAILRQSVFKLGKTLASRSQSAFEAAEEVRGKLDEFKPKVALVSVLTGRGLKDRHWTQLSEVVGFDLRPNDSSLTLAKLVELGCVDHIEQLERVSEAAAKEYAIQEAVTNMQEEWKPLRFEMSQYKDTNSKLLQGSSVDEIQVVLDDHIVRTQTVSASPHAATLADSLSAWEDTLHFLQSLLDIWIEVQSKWLYIEPIFSSEDILKQLPEEGAAFQVADRVWNQAMARVSRLPNCIRLAEEMRDLPSQFQIANDNLDLINRGLAKYLETKRLYFARFFFLSNDELLEILCETKDPKRVQPFLKKCFEGISSLEFDNRNEITHMISSEGERVELSEVVIPSRSHGQVEVWLSQLEAEMRKTCNKVTRDAMADYVTKPRVDWIGCWPGQIVLGVSSLFWTHDVEAVIQGKTRICDVGKEPQRSENQDDSENLFAGEALRNYQQVLSDRLLDVVSKVRGELSVQERCTLSALAVLDVHARDVVGELADLGISSTEDFDWTAQMRYYWRSDSLWVHIMTSALEYGYEYLGNSGRLVITPLTDRCYRTLMGALHLQYGGAPEGPAGTGKTETTKDLAKALARQCLVFNCSDGLDYMAMAKLFKGIASSGAWACFDEFNRIELEVLSVVAQQILCIQQAISQRLETFNFEGTNIECKWTANVFITMNPGYAGRAELPDNLKALFRTVAMMVPDYAMIAEIILLSNGYSNARILARKIVSTYTLCSEQLSSQDHYDYGMRAVISVLKSAGRLKRQFPDESEDVLVLRSICDVNIAKFLSHDLPLFRGIISDLFPDTKLPPPDYEDLIQALNQELHGLGMEVVSVQVEKILQLYEMVVVRHGLMVVGPPLAGKTVAWKSLSRALTQLCGANKLPCKFGDHELATDTFVINPKSITIGQLYGCFDPVSHEWSDGILAKTYRDCARSNDNRRKWILFDGPVDAVWIENMNTVLDDNKKLCLMSGETIAMSDEMTLMFEPMDLAVASPATVSRCGMVYMEPEKLGWEPHLQAWLRRYRHVLGVWESNRVMQMAEELVPKLLSLCRNKLNSIVPTTDGMLVSSFVRTLESLFIELGFLSKEDLLLPIPKQDSSQDESLTNELGQSNESDNDDDDNSSISTDNSVQELLENAFLFALVWTFGGSLGSEADRIKFDRFLKHQLVAHNDIEGSFKPFVAHFPENQSVFEVFPASKIASDVESYDTWLPWTSLFPEQPNIPLGSGFKSIIVPTVDSTRCDYMLSIAVKSQKSILFVGPTGTGKTKTVVRNLSNMDESKMQYLCLGFSAQTSASVTQSTIETKLERKRKGLFAPTQGRSCVVFVDDLNMPKVEEYGAQPPLELLRQAMKYKLWYDPKDLSTKSLINLQYVAAMGTPGGGRNNISPRILRHFHIVAVPSYSDASMIRIFSILTNWLLRDHQQHDDIIIKLKDKIVLATLQLMKGAILHLLPTPSKSHYLFNLRDYGRVIQGLSQVSVSSIQNNRHKFVRLWVHESLRIFGDRLVESSDRNWLVNEALHPILKEHFDLSFDTLFNHLQTHRRRSSLGDLASSLATEGDTALTSKPGSPMRKAAESERTHIARSVVFTSFHPSGMYDEIIDFKQAQETITTALDDFNNMSGKPMSLVIFMYAVEHLARILRVIELPGSHALLVGVGGSGRKSLTHLAAFLANCDVFQIAINKTYSEQDWHNDIKELVRETGGKGNSVVFLFSDTQIKHDVFLEDVNNLLNSGEVPNLFSADEKAEICELARPAAKAAGVRVEGIDDLYTFVVNRVRALLHLVLCFSPVGDALRMNLRKFPSLVNCCIIDWFSAWPADALTSVANHFLADVDVGEDVGGRVKREIVELCKEFHVSCAEYAVRFQDELRRITYVTPTSFLELINTFKELLCQKQGEVHKAKKRYDVGLEKLLRTDESVHTMQRELVELQPVLQATTRETEDMMEVVQREQLEADKIANIVKQEEAIAAEKAQHSRQIKEECEHELAQAMPILQSAIAALNTLNKNDISEVKAMKSPPDGVKLVMEAMCVMMHIKPFKVVKEPADSGTLSPKKVNDYWEPAKKFLLSDPKLLQHLIDYDKDNIDPKVIDKMEVYVNNPKFDPDTVRKASKAAYGLCCWARAMVKYDRIAKVVAPKREALNQAEREYGVVMQGLQEKQGELEVVESKVQKLAEKLQECKSRKCDLEQQVEECKAKLNRAEALIQGLGGEKTRWFQESAKLEQRYENLVGDVLVCAGVIGYLGVFTVNYRREVLERWTKLTQERKLPCSAEISFVDTLGNSIQTREWIEHGLPVDPFSIENGIITNTTRRWPLMIDPQAQANKWIRKMEADNDLAVIKLTDANFVRVLENSIPFGKPVLLENIGETIPTTLEPLLSKQLLRKGGVSYMKLGDTNLEFSEHFRFYITTKLRNPHYLPEISVKVTILNFMITLTGLEDQLLGMVVANEKPDLELEKNQLILQSADNLKKLQEVENRILHILSTSEGNILEDGEAINALSSSKIVADDISQKQRNADETRAKIDVAREQFVPLAKRAATMFFCVADLAAIEPMYQYSLEWFYHLFLNSLRDTPPNRNLTARLNDLSENFMDNLYRNVCRSLFEKDRLLFSFLLCVRLILNGTLYSDQLSQSVSISHAEWKFLLTGESIASQEFPQPESIQWLPSECWKQVCALEAIDSTTGGTMGPFQGLVESLEAYSTEWQAVYDSDNPLHHPYPRDWEARLSMFQKLCVLRVLRPDKVVPGLSEFVEVNLGKKYVLSPAFDLQACYSDSSPSIPLVYVLSAGSDPMTSLTKLSEDHNVTLNSLSLGQGQGPLAERMIEIAIEEGNWVVLQNCHLYPSWMPTLEQIVDTLSEQLSCEGASTKSKSFRLWLTSYPSDKFPVTILQNGIKMTNEAPRGLRANLLASLNTDPIKSLSFLAIPESNYNNEFRRLLYGLCFFHAIVQERRTFGSLGWNIPYEFNETDLRISAQQLRLFVDEYSTRGVSYKALQYAVGECNYGGRVTDDRDRRTLKALVKLYLSENLGNGETHALSPSGDYTVPGSNMSGGWLPESSGAFQDFMFHHVEQLPLQATPEVFGIHANGDIAKEKSQTLQFFESILSTEPRSSVSASGDSVLDSVRDVAEDILKRMPKLFNLEKALERFPLRPSQSFNTVLNQELGRYNELVETIKHSLETLVKATRGLLVISSDIETLIHSIVSRKIPNIWAVKSYPSVKPLGAYISDLLKRLDFFRTWMDCGQPTVFWISGIFFTQSFLTAALQNFARRHQHAIDTTGFAFGFGTQTQARFASSTATNLPSSLRKRRIPVISATTDEVSINGLFLEGAQWEESETNNPAGYLTESSPKVLFSNAPLIRLIPHVIGTREEPEYLMYQCPVYRTSERRGSLSTTGHSTNFVMNVDFPSRENPGHWICRGVAMLTQLNY